MQPHFVHSAQQTSSFSLVLHPQWLLHLVLTLLYFQPNQTPTSLESLLFVSFRGIVYCFASISFFRARMGYFLYRLSTILVFPKHEWTTFGIYFIKNLHQSKN